MLQWSIPKGAKRRKPTPCPTIIPWFMEGGGPDWSAPKLLFPHRTIKLLEKSLLEANWHLHSQCLDNLPHKLSWQHQVSQRFRIRLVKELVQPLLDVKASSTYPRYLCGVGRRRCVPWSATEWKTLPTKTSRKKEIQCVQTRTTSSSQKERYKNEKPSWKVICFFVFWCLLWSSPYSH